MFLRLLPILGITFIDILGFSILIPLMPFFVKHFGASDVVVGGVFATYSLCQLISGPLWGNLSDRIGRKAVLIVSQIGATLAWALLGFAPAIVWVFISRAIEGTSGGNFGVTQAYVADLVPPEQRGRAFALVGAAFSAGFIFGPAFGGWLAARTSLQMPFFAAAALQLVTLLLTVFLLPESNKGATEEARNAASVRDIFRSLVDPQISPIVWLRLVFVLGMYGWFAVMTLALNRQLGWNVAETSYVFAGFGVLQVILQLTFVGRFIDTIGNRNASNIGFIVLTSALVLFPLATATPAALAVLTLFGFGMSVENAAFPALASDAAPNNRRGTVLGIVSSMDSLAGAVMPPITTAVLGAYGVAPAAGIVAALAGIAAAMGLIQARGVAPLPVAAVE